LTPNPIPKNVDFSQEVKDIVDLATENMVPSLAVKHLEDALTKNMPDFQKASVYMTLGTKYEDLNNTEKAIDSYSKSIELYNGNSYPLLFRGELYFQEGRYEHANQDIRKAIGQGGLDDYNKNEGLSYLIQIKSKEK
jgi:tetratricopeptide (TPR) repeat protein